MLENTSIEKPKRSAGILVAELSPSVKTEWVKWCKERGLLPGKAVRVLVEKAMAEGLELATTGRGVRVKVKVLAGADEGAKVGREVYFTPSENAAIEAVSQAQGFGFHEWVIAAVRAALASAPSYGQAELEALTQSNGTLVQIKADLAALRRGATELQGEQIIELERGIQAHVVAASNTLAQGVRRWQIKV